jgi:hypothetical protein
LLRSFRYFSGRRGFAEGGGGFDGYGVLKLAFKIALEKGNLYKGYIYYI